MLSTENINTGPIAINANIIADAHIALTTFVTKKYLAKNYSHIWYDIGLLEVSEDDLLKHFLEIYIGNLWTCRKLGKKAGVIGVTGRWIIQ